MKQCPKCTKAVANDSWLCECGYAFRCSFHTILYTVTWFVALAATDPTLRMWPVGWMFPVGLFVFVFAPSDSHGPDSGVNLFWLPFLTCYGVYFVHGILYFRFHRLGPTVLLYSVLVLLLIANVAGCQRVLRELHH